MPFTGRPSIGVTNHPSNKAPIRGRNANTHEQTRAVRIADAAGFIVLLLCVVLNPEAWAGSPL
jgi:hypothetical protein